jgi:hypothetical protein
MKKIVLIMVILSVVFIGILPAQGLGFGVTGGFNMSKFVGDDVVDISDELDEKFLTGFAVGGFVTLPIGPLEGRVEALYTQNGAKYEGTEEGADASLSMKTNWLSFPVLAGMNFGSIRVFAGPYFDIFLSGNTKFEVSYEGMSFDGDEDIEGEDVTTLALGFVLGGAYAVMDNLDVELRMSRGLNTIDGTDDEDDFKPNVFSARVNYYLKK